MMNLTPYDPFTTFRGMTPGFDRLFGRELEGQAGDGSNVVTSRWIPAVDIKEEPDQFVITADIPGVDPKDIDVTMENGMLSIRGERKLDDEQESDGLRRVERVHGTFYRRFALPDHADPDGISARGANGVLTVTVPKTEKVRPRRIEVH